MRKRNKSGKLQLALLNELRQNSRQHISAIAKKIGMPVTSAFEAEKELREQGIITRYFSTVDFRKLGFALRAEFMLKTRTGQAEAAAIQLSKSAFVNNVFLSRGQCDIIAETVFRSSEQLALFENQISRLHLTEQKTFYFVEELKKEGAEIV